MNRYAQRVAELGGRFLHTEKQPNVTLSEEQLKAFEETIGYALPDDYREFLKEFGGYGFINEIVYRLANIPDGRTLGAVDTFYGIFPFSSMMDLLTRYHNYVDEQLIGPELLPITDEGGGFDAICLFLDGEKKGSVHLFYSEDAVNRLDYSYLYPISDSFEAFLHLLHPITEEEQRRSK